MSMAEDFWHMRRENAEYHAEQWTLSRKLDEANDRISTLEEQLEEARDLAIYWEHAYNSILGAHRAVKATLRAAIGAIT